MKVFDEMTKFMNDNFFFFFFLGKGKLGWLRSDFVLILRLIFVVHLVDTL